MTQRAHDKVFISYSHKDKKWLDRLQTTLMPLVRKEAITIWADTQIKPGTEWRDEIEKGLSSAKVAVLLVSQHFLASDFITNHELPELLRAAEKDGVTILWVALSACLYDETEISRYQSVNNPAKPLDGLKGAALNKELVNIARQIKAAALNKELVNIARQIKAAVSPIAGTGAASNEHKISNLAMPGDVFAVGRDNPLEEESLALIEAGPKPSARAEPMSRKKARLLIISATALLFVGLAIVYFVIHQPEVRVTTIPFIEDFDHFNEKRWNLPASGWSLESDKVKFDKWLYLHNAPVLVYPKDLNYRDFVMTFNLKLTDAGGAAWTVRVKDMRNYYLFYLFPDRVNVYIVKDGKLDPEDHFISVPSLVKLRVGEYYDVVITARARVIETKIISGKDGYETIMPFEDPNDTFPNGSIGFRTVGSEKFSVDDINVVPP